MDPRVERHAEVIVEHSVGVEAGDEVMINAPAEAEPLVVALNERLGERGARPVHVGRSARAQRAFMRAMDPDAHEGPPEGLMRLAEGVDVAIGVRAAANTHETGDVPPEKNSAYARMMKPIQEEMMAKRWVGTQHPAPGNAQDAEMSTEAYENFVYGAIDKDWAAQREHQEQLVDIL
ncbi:MAG: aminopeptidase, partial [Halobacteriales archaeon]